MNSYQKENRDYQKIKEEYKRISEEFDKTVREGGDWGELVEAYFNSVLRLAEATRQEKAVLLNTSEHDEELEKMLAEAEKELEAIQNDPKLDRELEEMLAEADKELETMLNNPELNKELDANGRTSKPCLSGTKQ